MTRAAWVALALVAACGDDERAGADADASPDSSTSPDDTSTSTTDASAQDADASAQEADAVEPPNDPWLGTAGSIEIIELYSGGAGEVMGTHVLVSMSDGVTPTRLVLVRESGACRLWLQDTTPCPSCAEGTTCAAGGACEAQPGPADAGTITLFGLAEDLTAVPAPPTSTYTVSPEPPIDGLFGAGATITVAIAGAGGFPASTTILGGVSDLEIGSIGLVELVDGHDFTLTWTPRDAFAIVEVVLQLGWHGAPPSSRIVCEAPDSAGALTIPAAIVDDFPYFEMGLFQVPSWIERLDRAMIQGPHGPIDARVASRVHLGVTHRAE